jgi:hypothetical protein
MINNNSITIFVWTRLKLWSVQVPQRKNTDSLRVVGGEWQHNMILSNWDQFNRQSLLLWYLQLLFVKQKFGISDNMIE